MFEKWYSAYLRLIKLNDSHKLHQKKKYLEISFHIRFQRFQDICGINKISWLKRITKKTYILSIDVVTVKRREIL